MLRTLMVYLPGVLASSEPGSLSLSIVAIPGESRSIGIEYRSPKHSIGFMMLTFPVEALARENV